MDWVQVQVYVLNDSCLPKHHGQMQLVGKGDVVEAKKKKRTLLSCEHIAVGKQTLCTISIKLMLNMPNT